MENEIKWFIRFFSRENSLRFAPLEVRVLLCTRNYGFQLNRSDWRFTGFINWPELWNDSRQLIIAKRKNLQHVSLLSGIDAVLLQFFKLFRCNSITKTTSGENLIFEDDRQFISWKLNLMNINLCFIKILWIRYRQKPVLLTNERAEMIKIFCLILQAHRLFNHLNLSSFYIFFIDFS